MVHSSSFALEHYAESVTVPAHAPCACHQRDVSARANGDEREIGETERYPFVQEEVVYVFSALVVPVPAQLERWRLAPARGSQPLK
jgi:hypothetical protein